MPSASKSRTNMVSGTSESEVSIYRDTEFPWIQYIGTRSEHNLKGPRNRWMVVNERNSNENTGPFPTLRIAWTYVHGETLPAKERVSYNAASYTMPNGTKPNGPEITEVADIISPPTEISDQMIEFSCPHCGKAVIGLLARK